MFLWYYIRVLNIAIAKKYKEKNMKSLVISISFLCALVFTINAQSAQEVNYSVKVITYTESGKYAKAIFTFNEEIQDKIQFIRNMNASLVQVSKDLTPLMKSLKDKQSISYHNGVLRKYSYYVEKDALLVHFINEKSELEILEKVNELGYFLSQTERFYRSKLKRTSLTFITE